MSFQQFLSNWRYRRHLAAEFERFQNIQPPKNPSRRYMDRLVRKLCQQHTAWAANKELGMIGAAAVPSLLAGLERPDAKATFNVGAIPFSPFEHMIELLVPYAPDQVERHLWPLVTSASDDERKFAAVHLASLGRPGALQSLATLLNDQNGYVRSYVRIGAQRAVADGRATGEFRRGMYDLLLVQCDQKWPSALNDAPEAVVALDPVRAAADFGSARWLTIENSNAHRILNACNGAGIALPEPLLRDIYEESTSRITSGRCYPFDYVAAEALTALVSSAGESVRPLLEAALESENEHLAEAGARGVASLAGIPDPASFVVDACHQNGFESLTEPQRVVYCAFLFDAEVCNGGIMQFFGNSSGDHVVETLAALRELGQAEALNALDAAVKAAGPLSMESDRELRLTAFEGRYDELKSLFSPLESAYYKTNHQLRIKWQLFAARHAEHFRPADAQPQPNTI